MVSLLRLADFVRSQMSVLAASGHDDDARHGQRFASRIRSWAHRNGNLDLRQVSAVILVPPGEAVSYRSAAPSAANLTAAKVVVVEWRGDSVQMELGFADLGGEAWLPGEASEPDVL